MQFSFEVGTEEKHSVEFSFNPNWGNLSIKVDGHKEIRDFRAFSFNLTKSYEFQVGDAETHMVRIEKMRKLFFAGFRKSNYKVFIDGVLKHEYSGR